LYQIVPEVGSFSAFKQLSGGTVVELLIPVNAERVGGYTGRKCRASKAVVVDGSGESKFDNSFVYKQGKMVIPDKWDDDPRIECGPGIHFFLTRKEAEEYS
jgi:hypothetical protein